MPPIESFTVNLQTGFEPGAGTDGDVYVGVCGREFYLDTASDDFVQGQPFNYTFGAGANTLHAEFNDPRNPQLHTENIGSYPVYLRFVPQGRDDNWYLLRAVIWFNGEIVPHWDTRYSVGGDGLWLGTRRGLVVHVPLHDDSLPLTGGLPGGAPIVNG